MARDVLRGFLFSRWLRIPLKINGKEWIPPDGFIPPTEAWLPRREGPTPSIKSIDDLAEAWGLERGSRGQNEVARRICWCLDRAERTIEKLGLELGVLEPRPPALTQERPEWLGPARKHAPEPECPEPAITEIADETQITVPGVTYAVRHSGASWYVVRIADRLGDTLASWHPSRGAALAWAVAQAKENRRPGGAWTRETSWGV